MLVALVFIGLFLYLYVLPLQSESFLPALPAYSLFFVITLVLAIIDLISFAHDPLQYGEARKNKYTQFFTAQFPSSYIALKNQIVVEEARNLWFGEFNKWKDPQHSNHEYWARAFQIGYRCREVYNIQQLAKYLGVVSLLFLLFICFASRIPLELPDFYYANYPGVLIVLRGIYPLFLLSLYLYLRKANNIDKPTGVWLAWKQHNDTLKAWWERNYPSV